jgi:CheY-like chemotaxis protein
VNISNIEHEEVIGDSLRIQQVFMNLIGNAIKYTPDGGRIHLAITEKKIHQIKSAFYEVVIEDNGIGMSEEFIQHIFEPFVRAEDERICQIQGTGLGMSIARNIIRMMGGDIRVESRLNYGTKVTVTFFLKLQENTPVSYAKFLDLPILVADDDQISCESACTILNDMGMKSEWVLSGREAVRRVTERNQKNDDFFAVILDWKMPDMDGVETAKAIRRAVGEEVPIIIISAYDWSGIEQEARKAGVNAFISKPLFPSRMITLFTNLVENHTNPSEKITFEEPLASLEMLHFEKKRILLVEDNELNAEIAKEILETTGVTVEIAVNGKEAVDRVNSTPPYFYDLILMDIQMPIKNGYEATKSIRAIDRIDIKTLPIVAMTANAFTEDIETAKACGMNGHIAKPLDLDALAKVLQKWLS